MSKQMDDELFMKRALELAVRGQGRTTPNPMVGAVVVKDARIIGEGYHEAAGRAHAEVSALEAAGSAAAGATLYVTLEPCNHTGRTPPCTEKILGAGIRRVVVAMADPNPHVKGGGIDFIRKRGVEVTTGVQESRARRLNEAYVKYITTGLPFVVVKCAATLDGWIATGSGDSRWVSGQQSRQYVHRLRHAMDAILVGVDTIVADDPRLTARLNGVEGMHPRRIILDTHLRISDNARVLRTEGGADTIVVTGPSISQKRAKKVAGDGVRVLAAPVKNGRIDLDALMPLLGSMQVTSLLIEGGGAVIGSALRDQVVDKILFFYAPKIFGGDNGVPMCRGSGPDLMKDCMAVEDINVHRFGDDVMIEGYVRSNPIESERVKYPGATVAVDR
jgi:diaminohydroxyphosphoribosylaminopyrimidine deaminase/5-amino-6-(5-phosphoribosylamino)uracil reductase